jgi:hypothetical protein
MSENIVSVDANLVTPNGSTKEIAQKYMAIITQADDAA